MDTNKTTNTENIETKDSIGDAKTAFLTEVETFAKKMAEAHIIDPLKDKKALIILVVDDSDESEPDKGQSMSVGMGTGGMLINAFEQCLDHPHLGGMMRRAMLKKVLGI